MSKQLKPITAAALVLGIMTLLLLHFAMLPAYAQGGAGDQIRNSVDPLFSSGDGANRVLTSNMQSLDPGEQDVYRFDYDGSNQPIKVSLDSVPANAVQFQVWTDSMLNDLNNDPNKSPLGTGQPISSGSEFSVWTGGDSTPQVYYVAVKSAISDTARYLLNIQSGGLAPTQPGVATSVPVTVTATFTPVPPGPTPTPTDTPAPNVTPNVTIVTATP